MSSVSGLYSNYMLQNQVSSLFGSNSTSSAATDLYSLMGMTSSSNTSYASNTASNSQLLNYVTDLEEASAKIGDAMSKLRGEDGKTSIFEQSFGAVSSNTDAVGVSYTNGSKVNADDQYAIKADQIATTQKNEGASLNASGYELYSGQHTFTLEIDGKETDISFTTKASDNNKTAQQKMADAINSKNIGVTAKVEYDKDSNTSKLVIESNKTGIDEGKSQVFSISDKSGYDAVASFGVNNITQNAQNASYVVGKVDTAKSTKDNIVFIEGTVEAKTSKSNDIKLNDNLTATLKATSTSYTTIGYKNDDKAAINSIRELVNGFNMLTEAAKDQESSGNASAGKLADKLSQLAQTYDNSLEKIGITKNSAGYLEIDEKKMNEAAENGEIKNFIQEDEKITSIGFANKLDSLAKSIRSEPYQYVSGGSSSSSQMVGDDTGAVSNYSMLFRMNQYQNVGQLFNSSF